MLWDNEYMYLYLYTCMHYILKNAFMSLWEQSINFQFIISKICYFLKITMVINLHFGKILKLLQDIWVRVRSSETSLALSTPVFLNWTLDFSLTVFVLFHPYIWMFCSIVGNRSISKNEIGMANIVDLDEKAHYEPSHLDLPCLQSNLVWSTGLRELGPLPRPQ